MKSLMLGRPLQASQDQAAVPSSTPRLSLAPGACLIREVRMLWVRMLHYLYIPALPLSPLGICASLLTFHVMFFVEFLFFTLSLFAICHVFLSRCWCYALQCPPQDVQLFFGRTTGFAHMLKLQLWSLMGLSSWCPWKRTFPWLL